MMQTSGTTPRTGPEPALLAALAAAAAILLFIVIGVVDIVVDFDFIRADGATRWFWLAVAVAIASSALVGARRPMFFGVSTGVSAVAGVVLLTSVMSLVRRVMGDMVTEVSFYALLVTTGLLVAAVVTGLRYRWARDPLTSPELGTALVVVGAVVAVALTVPMDSSFKNWNQLSNLDVETFGWLLMIAVLGGSVVLGGVWRSAFGRGLAAGALLPVAVSVAGARVFDDLYFYVPFGEGHVVLLLALLAGVGVVVAAQVTATERIVDVEPSRSVSMAPSWGTGQPAFSPTSGPGGAGGAAGSALAGSGSSVSGPFGSMQPPTVYASVGARFGAFVIDGIISFGFLVPGYAMVIGGAASESGGGMVFGLLVLMAGSIAYPIFYCRRVGSRGQSWGHQACGVRVVDARTGATIGAWRAFGRGLVRGLAAMPCYLGLAWAFWDPQRRGWHDMAVGTVVVPAQAAGTSWDVAPPPPPPLLDDRPPPPPQVFDERPAPPVDDRPFAGSAPSFAAPSPSFAAPVAPAPAAPVAVVPPARESPWAPQVADDERTVARSSLVPPSAPAASLAQLAVVFDDGGRVVLDRTLIIGRDPSPSPSDPGALLIGVDDPTMSVSKTHLAVGVDAGAAWVEDRHSTNGVMVTTDGEQLKVITGRRIRLSVGTSVQFGDRSFTIVDGPA